MLLFFSFFCFCLFQSIQRIPVGAAVPFRNIAHFFAQFVGDLTGQQTPAPVDLNGAGGVHAAGIVQAHPVLDGYDAGIGSAHHGQVDELLVHPLVRGIMVTQIVADMLLVLLVQTRKPAGNGLVYAGYYFSDLLDDNAEVSDNNN